METLRILVISSVGTPTPPKDYGGLEWIAYLIAKGMHKRGHKVSVIASRDSNKSDYPEGIELIRTVYSQFTPIPEHLSYQIWNSKLKERWKEFDIIHDNSHSQFSVLTQRMFLLSKQDFPKVIRTLHDDVPFSQPPPLPFPNIVGVSFTHSERLSASLGIITRTVYHGIPIQNFSFSKEKDDYFLFLGRIQPIKGVHIALEIAKYCGIKLYIAGDDTHIPNYKYPQIIKRLCNEKNIKYLGKVSQEVKKRLLTKAKACIFPSQFHEPFGLMVIEAQASGTPCIVSDRGGLSETTLNGKTGFVCSNYQDYFRAIKEIDSIKPEECLRRANYFSIDRMIENYMKLYKDILDNKEW